ncbi:MAG: hypothetical protein ABJF23_02115 [Bryobacteraceae bacterium]
MASIRKKFVQHVVPGVIKPVRVIWNEFIAFLFFALAVLSVPSAYRHIRDFEGDAQSLFRTLLTCGFALIMIVFGVFSYLRARKISRS